jgi:hypothetical protein
LRICFKGKSWLSECRKVFENQKEPESGIRAGFAVLLAYFFLNYKPQNT